MMLCLSRVTPNNATDSDTADRRRAIHVTGGRPLTQLEAILQA
jgi:hypothetical protein